MLQAPRRAEPAVDVEKELRMCRRALDPERAEGILAALGIRGEVARCWVDCRPGKPRRHAVLAATGERWPGTRVPVERVFYLLPPRGGSWWILDGSCRAMLSEWHELEEAEEQARARRTKRGAGGGLAELVEEALAAAGL